MQIVIKIPDELYNDIKTHPLFSSDIPAIERAIKNGTPLPKGLIPITDVMSVFDDFMCGDVDEDGANTFYEMLKEKVVGADEN